MPGCSQLPHSRAGGRGAGRGHPPLLLLLFVPFPSRFPLHSQTFLLSFLPLSSSQSRRGRGKRRGGRWRGWIQDGFGMDSGWIWGGFRMDSGIQDGFRDTLNPRLFWDPVSQSRSTGGVLGGGSHLEAPTLLGLAPNRAMGTGRAGPAPSLFPLFPKFRSFPKI